MPNDLGKPGGRATRPRQDALGNKVPNPDEELALLERELHEVKVAYEQFFLGSERRSPVRRKDALGERIRRLKNAGVMRGAALKFRLEQIHSRFLTYERLWARTVSEIESGTHKRDLFKMKRRQAKAAEAAAPPVPAAPQPPAAAPLALSEQQVRQLYDTLLVARQRTQEPTDNLSLEKLSSNLQRQVPELLRKHGCSAIDFKVVIRDGKALLKAVPRK